MKSSCIALKVLIALTILVSVTNAAEKEKDANKKQVHEEPPKKKEDSSNGHGQGESSGGGRFGGVTHDNYPTYANVWGQQMPDHKEATKRIIRDRFGKN